MEIDADWCSNKVPPGFVCRSVLRSLSGHFLIFPQKSGSRWEDQILFGYELGEESVSRLVDSANNAVAQKGQHF